MVRAFHRNIWMPDSESSQPEPTLRFQCPQCLAAVRASDILCPSCGINLALAAVLAERQVIAAAPAASGEAVEAKLFLPRFGEFLVQNGYATEEQLQVGLARQTEAAEQGIAITIGQVLLSMGVLTREQLDEAGIRQVKELQATLQEHNQQLERRVAERTQELHLALNKLAELNELKANFVANISHELRTPLVPIKGYTALFTTGSLGELNARQSEAFDVITRSVERLEELVTELIQFASSVKGQMTIALSVVSLHDLSERLLDFFVTKAVTGDVRLSVDLPASLPLASADGEKIYWVLFQLLDNAIKFTPAGGAVTLSAEARADRLRVSVRDTGIGVAPDRVNAIFQPFHQLGGDVDHLVDGTGLGLALVKRIVEAHDSRVQVESQPGRGSTFSFELPAAAQK
jgi:signal transduction histidine kinase